MKIMTTRRAALGAALVMPALAMPMVARAQDNWPNRPVRFIVAFAAGGAADTAARSIAADMQESLGQNIVIENRTGGNATIAANATLQSPRDGYTFLVDAANQLTNPVLMRDLGFDYQRDFVPVTQISSFPQVIAVKTEFPARNLAEFIAYAKANPNTVSVGTPPAAGMAHLALAAFEQQAGIRLVHAPYRGGADAARDIMSGSIDAVRIPSLPDVPTIAESGFPGYDMNDWNGVFAATGTPVGPITRIAATAAVSARAAAVRARMDPAGAIMVGSSPEVFANWLDGQRRTAVDVVRSAGITLG
jgi:tripartite-type tricarboxylate transporter receptor subunit TctC